MGREAREEYGEDLAPAQADNCTMGSCILFTVGKADHPVPFVKPDFAYDYQKDDILKFVDRPQTGRNLPKKLDGVDGIWWLSVGGMENTDRIMRDTFWVGVYPGMTGEMIDYMAKTIVEAVE